MMGRVELLTWHVTALMTAKANKNIGQAFIHAEEIQKLVW